MICKIYGGLNVTGADGKTVKWLWDYDKDEPVKESELIDKKKRLQAFKKSEKKKWEKYKKELPKLF